MRMSTSSSSTISFSSSSLLSLASNAEAVRKRREEEPMPSAAGAASNGVATDGSPAALYARTASNSCGSGSFKTPGRITLLPLSSVPAGRRTTPPPRCDEWWSAVATAAAMLTSSCRHHERIRRCLRRWAAPEGCPLASITKPPQKKGQP